MTCPECRHGMSRMPAGRVECLRCGFVSDDQDWDRDDDELIPLGAPIGDRKPDSEWEAPWDARRGDR